jgi:CRP-like cAMP-binding protein
MATAGAGIPLRSFRPGEIIFRQGKTASTEAYFGHRGRVEVRRTIGGDERVLCTLGIGELLGEVALFRQGPHSPRPSHLKRFMSSSFPLID